MTRRFSVLSYIGPVLSGLAAVLLSFAPVSLSAPGLQGPHWLLMVFYFWASRRPWTTPPLLVFALALPFDLLRDGPIGAELFATLLVVEGARWMAERQPPFTFWAEWARFVLAVCAFELTVGLMMAITYAPGAGTALVWQRGLMAILLYPLLAYALQRVAGARIGEGRFTHLTF